MPRAEDASLTIGQLAELTGVTVPTLRSWEARHGFPTPRRSASGHRRYRSEVVALIAEVTELRRHGLSLEAAIERSLEPRSRTSQSVFAHLGRTHRDLPVQTLSAKAMRAVSHAIEDECRARASRPWLIGSFQTEDRYRAAELRWREIARTAAGVMVMAGFEATSVTAAGPLEVALGISAPMRREWAVICDSSELSACLVGWEVTPAGASTVGEAGAESRRYEAVWTADAAVVTEAASAAYALARQVAPEVASLLPDPEPRPAASQSQLRSVTALTNRILAYLDRS